MEKTKTRRAQMEARPVASRPEVQAAVLQGHLTGLLKKRRVPLSVAVDTLAGVRLFLANTDDLEEATKAIPDDDARIATLVKHIQSLRNHVRNASSMLRETKALGQTIRYKALRNKQRKDAYLHLPLGTIEREGETLKYVYVHLLDEDTIIVKRTTKKREEQS